MSEFHYFVPGFFVDKGILCGYNNFVSIWETVATTLEKNDLRCWI